jgi:hypothetical protein
MLILVYSKRFEQLHPQKRKASSVKPLPHLEPLQNIKGVLGTKSAIYKEILLTICQQV